MPTDDLDHSAALARVERARRYARLAETGELTELDAADDALVITESGLEPPGPIVTYANPAFERLTGYTIDGLRGSSPRVLQGYDTDRDELDRMRQALAAGGPFHGEILNYRRDGSEYVIGWAVVAVLDDAGQLTGWLSLQNDVLGDARDRR